MKNWQSMLIGVLIGLILAGGVYLIVFINEPPEFSYISPTYSPTLTVDSDAVLTATKININTATISELDSLSGIGEQKARDIIDFREKNGKFVSIEDLLYVPGIGQSLFDQIKDDITVQ
jgi:competence protein ComEA